MKRSVLYSACLATAFSIALSSCSTAPRADLPQPQIDPLQALTASLEQRKTLLQDLNDIKRLQRAYGYYVDEAQWDDVANLFADDGSIELGLDGVFQGKKRVREYLLALGKGRIGLAPGQLNEHLQLMPVVTMGADGSSAKGTWRAVILAGQLGENAVWGEGPYENDYVKQDGIWKIRRLHWFQTLLVPYDGGWAKNGDVNAGRFVRTLKSDAPPTVDYKTWPGSFVPPFHFKTGTTTTVSPFPASPQIATTGASRVPLAQRVAVLAQEVQLLRAQADIENLQRIYGFYIDKGQWDDAAALFSSDAQLTINGRGTYVGREHVLRYLQGIGPAGPAEGRLFDNMQLQPVVHVAADGQTAKARWHLFAQLAQAKQFHEWSTGVYENEYVLENGVWRISRLHLYPTMVTPYDEGWGKTSQAVSRLESKLAPDRVGADRASTFDHVFVAPYHYGNPVTSGQQRSLQAAVRRAAATDQSASLQQTLAQVQQQIARLEDVAQIENLQTIYGYYLATLEWDALAGLFSPTGTIEIALRGIYVGRDSVRRNLNLYGQQGLDQGVLHNHMQYQFVIHVAADGTKANLRSRALSMMGNFNRNATWMGGVYENEFVKEDGVWRFKKDQVMNTYFAPYETGWKDLALRPAPGITDANPPDRPPSFTFEMYPKNFLPPYHYSNPGKAAM